MSRSIFCVLCGVCVAAAGALHAADNLIFNGGFELDTASYELVRYQRPDRNPTLAFELLVVDTTTFHSGTRSLRVPNRHGELGELFTRGVALKQGTRYSVSVWMKSENGGLGVTPLLCSNGYYPAKGRSFTVGKTWQKYAFSFTTGAGEVTGNGVWFQLNQSEAVAPNDLWIDDFQVYEDPSTNTAAEPFTYSAEVEIAAAVDKPFYQGPGQTANVALTLKNASARAVDGVVDLRLEEDSGNAPVVVASVGVMLEAGERKVVTVSLPLARYGSFTLVPVAQLGATVTSLPACFAVVPQYTPAQAHLNLDTTFCVGANMGLHSGRGPRGTLRACGGSATQALDVYAALGGRLARIWDAGHQFEWRTIEPTKGQMDFAATDLLVEAMYERGISVLPVLGGVFLTDLDGTYDSGSTFPQWLIESSSRSEHTLQWFLDLGRIAFLPGDTDWRRHVDAVVQRYKGKIDHWEITNEPDIWLPASEYMPYLKSASEVIKAADPSGQPVCFGAMKTHLAECVALGAESYAAINSIHPYGSRALGSPVPADETIAEVLAATTMKPWLTELYYLAEGVEWGDATVVHPIHVARRFLTDIGEGLGQSIPLADAGLWRRTLNPGFQSPDLNSSFLPSANLVAYDALACYFEGAKPRAKLRWGNDTICYVYERDGAPLAACWVFRDGAADLPVALPSSIAATTVLDVFGNTVASPDGAFSAVQMPQYLVAPPGVNTAEFIAALQSCAPMTVAVSPTGVSSPGQTVQLQAVAPAWPGRTVRGVTFSVNGVVLGAGIYNTATERWELNYTTEAGATGVVTIAAAATDSAGRTTEGRAVLMVGAVSYGNGGWPRAVPASGVVRIPAAAFDQGGNGVAFLEKDTGNGDWLGRSSGTNREVDVYSSASEGLRVGGILNGEWLNYALTVPADGRYDVRLRVANQKGSGLAGAQVSLKWKSALVATKVVVPQTNDWDEFTDLEIPGVVLTAGTSTFQIFADTWGWTYAWIEIGAAQTLVAGNHTPVVTPASPVALHFGTDGRGTIQLAATDADGDTLAWSIPLPPSHGAATVSTAGNVSYAATAGFAGQDAFQVRVSDGRGGSATVRVDCTRLPLASVEPLVWAPVVGMPVLLSAQVQGGGATASVTYYADGVELGTGTLRDCGWGVVWTPANAGTVRLTARATDVVGLTGPVSPVREVVVLGSCIVENPAPATAPIGSPAQFSVMAQGTVSYQWERSLDGGQTWSSVADGGSYSGTNTRTLTVTPASPAQRGSLYRCVVTNIHGSSSSDAAALSVPWSQFSALSARAQAGTGEQTLMLGFVFAGGGKPALVRGVGPGLVAADDSLTGRVLVDPQLKLYELQPGGFTLLAENDNWGGASDLRAKFAELGLGALADASKDAALQLAAPGALVYSAHVAGTSGSGIALAEAYDGAVADKTRRLTALSVRNQVGAGADMLIAGFVLVGDAPKRVIVRGLGPGIAGAVSAYLADPRVQVYRLKADRSGWDMVAENDDWDGTSATADAFDAVGMGALRAGSKDAALIVELAPGIYTAQLSGSGGATGVGLVEIYEAP
jgi:hypothetical protein